MHSEKMQQAIELMEKAKDVNAHFSGPAAEDDIANAESLLQVRFDEDYRRFLSSFGSGSFGFFEVFGLLLQSSVTSRRPDDLLFETENWRSFQVTERAKEFYVVASPDDGCDWILKSNDLLQGDYSPVFVWDMGENYDKVNPHVEYESFGHFFLQQVQDAIDFARSDD
jgi:hypothetical protein